MSAIAVDLLACASSRPPRPTFVPPPPHVQVGAARSGAAIGLVLTGGGAFGAWEIGALQAFFDVWYERHGEEPPIRVVAGTSTGALLAPFAFLGRRGLEEAAAWYTAVEQGDLLRGRLAALLLFALFADWASSPFSAGYPERKGGDGSHLYRILSRTLDEADLERIAAAWPERRIGAVTVDFGDGQPDVVTNQPGEMSRFRDGVFASAQVPLVMPPVPLPPGAGAGGREHGDALSPHLDGGVLAVAPIAALFELAAIAPSIRLTHVVVISPFPKSPSADQGGQPFPDDPDFRQIGDRMTTLLGEALVSKDLALVRAALELRNAGLSAAAVREVTGMSIAGEPPELIEILPASRLGWRALEFDRDVMGEMHERGYFETRARLHDRSGVLLFPRPAAPGALTGCRHGRPGAGGIEPRRGLTSACGRDDAPRPARRPRPP
ncbi:MAG: patatin-like phospholipase family protein [Gemmatimonadota bacterium]